MYFLFLTADIRGEAPSAGGPLWKLDKDLKLRADLAQNDTISPCRVLDQVASMGFQLFACPECEYQNVYVFVRRDGGL